MYNIYLNTTVSATLLHCSTASTRATLPFIGGTHNTEVIANSTVSNRRGEVANKLPCQ